MRNTSVVADICTNSAWPYLGQHPLTGNVGHLWAGTQLLSCLGHLVGSLEYSLVCSSPDLQGCVCA